MPGPLKLLRSRWLLPSSVTLCLLVIYGLSAPSTVQTLDTGEMVARSSGPYLLHPPGFPAFMWIYHMWLSLFDSDKLFSGAVWLTIAFSCASAFLLTDMFARIALPMAAAILSLYLSPVFWKYGMLPDAFALNNLLLVALVYTMRNGSGTLRDFLVFLIFALGCANHQIFVFLLPLPLFYFLAGINRLQIWAAAFTGLFVLILLYGSLFLIETDHPLSFREIASFSDFWQHFTRADYGGMQLTAKSTWNLPTIYKIYFWHQLELFWPVFLLLSITISPWFRKGGNPPMIFFASRYGNRDSNGNENGKDHDNGNSEGKGSEKPSGSQRSLHAWLNPLLKGEMYASLTLSYILYLVIFFGLSNIDPYGIRYEAFSRFLLMPSILLALLLFGLVERRTPGSPRQWNAFRFWTIPMLLQASLWVYVFYPSVDMSQDTVIEDYATNLLNHSIATARPNTKPVLLYQGSDTIHGAVLYLQATRPEYRSVLAFNPLHLRLQRYRERMSGDLNLPPLPKGFRNMGVIPFAEAYIPALVSRNQSSHSFFHYDILVFAPSTKQRLELFHTPAGQSLRPGLAGMEFCFDCPELLARSAPGSPDRSAYKPQHQFFVQYARFYLQRGLNHPEHLSRDARAAYEIAPYYAPARRVYCKLQMNGECTKEAKNPESYLLKNPFVLFPQCASSEPMERTHSQL